MEKKEITPKDIIKVVEAIGEFMDIKKTSTLILIKGEKMGSLSMTGDPGELVIALRDAMRRAPILRKLFEKAMKEENSITDVSMLN